MEGMEGVEAVRQAFGGAGAKLVQAEQAAGIQGSTVIGATTRGILSAVCAWARPLAYRDAGERIVRKYFAGLVVSALVWSAIFWGIIIIAASAGIPQIVLVPGPLTGILEVWAVGMAIAERLALNSRISKRQYVMSKFIGWPRIGGARYTQQVLIFIGVGVLLMATTIDRGTGLILLLTGLALWAELIQMAKRRRNQSLDELDAQWNAAHRAQALGDVHAGAAESERTSSAPKLISSADIVRHMAEL